jgi:hypothetical protein
MENLINKNGGSGFNRRQLLKTGLAVRQKEQLMKM